MDTFGDAYETSGQVAGYGGYGCVKIGVNVNTEEPVAVKVVRKHKRNIEWDEGFILYYLGENRHITRLYDVFETETQLCYVFELGVHGELYSLINRKKKLPERVALRYSQQVASALRYCHRKGIVHRDVKAENVFVRSSSNVMLGDFGFARVISGDSKVVTTCGTDGYRAPEIIEQIEHNGPEVDVWAFGIIVVVYLMIGVLVVFMTTGRMPFTGEGSYGTSQNIINCEVVFDLKASVSTDLFNMIMSIFVDCKDRPSIGNHDISSYNRVNT